MSNKKETNYLEDDKRIKFMKENYGWIIGTLTFLGIILSKVLEISEHLTSLTYFQYYGLCHELYNYEAKGFVYELKGINNNFISHALSNYFNRTNERKNTK